MAVIEFASPTGITSPYAGEMVLRTCLNQRLAVKAEADNQFSEAVGALNALRAMVVQPQLDAQFAAHFRGCYTHQARGS